MKINKYDTLATAITALEREGFTATFKLENGRMKCIDSGKFYEPEQMEIVEYHRFEGVSDPEDMSIVYAVDVEDGCKGVIIAPFGAYSDPDMIVFMDKVKIMDRDVPLKNHEPAKHLS